MEAVLVSIVTVTGIVLSVVGSFVPGWFVYVDQRGLDIRAGIWFKTECNTTCITTLHKDVVSRHETQYALQVASQVLSTLANIAGIVGCVLVVLGYKSSKYSLIAKEKSTRCFIVSFALMWRIVGFYAVEFDQFTKVIKDAIPGITYGLILSAIGSGLLFGIGIFNFISSKRKTLTPEYRLMHNTEFTEFAELYYSRTLLTVLFLVSAVGFFLQLVGFVSPGWDVQSSHSGLTHIGLWYQVDCESDASGKCEVTSLYDIYKKRMESDKAFAIFYGLDVGNEVCATISLFATGLSVMLGLITLVNTKRSTLLLNLIEMSCLISVLLNWPVIGEKVGYTVGRMRQDVIDGRTGTSYIFPYSAFLSAIGSTILSVVYLIHAIRYFRLLYKSQKEPNTSTHTNTFECSRM